MIGVIENQRNCRQTEALKDLIAAKSRTVELVSTETKGL